MSARDPFEPDGDAAADATPASASGADLLDRLMQGPAAPVAPQPPSSVNGVRIGHLLAIAEQGLWPLVAFEGQPAALRARTVVDLQGAHIGRQVVCQFEAGDPALPIVMGVLQGEAAWPLGERPAQVDVDVDGERLVVSAHEQLVLRCGKASITLTKAGKVLIDGNYLLSRSSGVNRIKGGSVQLN
jgi:Domain of unknown function (DUF6484)